AGGGGVGVGRGGAGGVPFRHPLRPAAVARRQAPPPPAAGRGPAGRGDERRAPVLAGGAGVLAPAAVRALDGPGGPGGGGGAVGGGVPVAAGGPAASPGPAPRPADGGSPLRTTRRPPAARRPTSP